MIVTIVTTIENNTTCAIISHQSSYLKKVFKKNLKHLGVSKHKNIRGVTISSLLAKFVVSIDEKGKSPTYPIKSVRMVLIPLMKHINTKNAYH